MVNYGVQELRFRTEPKGGKFIWPIAVLGEQP